MNELLFFSWFLDIFTLEFTETNHLKNLFSINFTAATKYRNSLSWTPMSMLIEAQLSFPKLYKHKRGLIKGQFSFWSNNGARFLRTGPLYSNWELHWSCACTSSLFVFNHWNWNLRWQFRRISYDNLLQPTDCEQLWSFKNHENGLQTKLSHWTVFFNVQHEHSHQLQTNQNVKMFTINCLYQMYH